MTTEEKAKAYDEALGRAKEMRTTLSDKAISEYIFPELKESEDEKIRKWIIDDIRYNMNNELLNNSEYKKEAEKAIAWLEKQEKQPKKVSIWKHWKDGIAGGAENEQIFLIKSGLVYSISSCLGYECDYIELSELDKLMREEEQGKTALEAIKEVKVDNANYVSVNDMFSIGDWVIAKGCRYKAKIKAFIENDMVEFEDGTFETEENLVKDYHLWTIQDAKDGDALSDGTTIFIFKDLLSDGSVMSYCDYDTDSDESVAFCPSSVNLMCSKIIPATKEQHDLLFSKMKEAGYEWDDEKKELKKFEKQGNTNETTNNAKFAQAVLRGAAINLITWIDYNAAEGNMCLSNMECKDIENALVSGDWDKIYGYIKKKLEKQGEQTPVISNDVLKEGVAHFGITQYHIGVEKQGEQKKDFRERYDKIADSEWFKKTHENMSVSTDEPNGETKEEVDG